MQHTHYTQLLGTAAGDYHLPTGPKPGYPREGHSYQAWLRGGKDIRCASGMFIAPDILVELNDCTAAQLTHFGIPHTQIRHLVISHGHCDHFQPEKVLDFAEKLSGPLQIYGNTMIRDALDFAAVYGWDDQRLEHVTRDRCRNDTMHTVTLEQPFNLDSVTVTPVPASHMIDRSFTILEQQALNFVFERDGKTLFYNLDSNWLLPKTLAFLSRYRFDIAIFDATWCDLTDIDIKGTGHHNFAMLEKTVGQFRERGMFSDNAVIVYSHLSTGNAPPHDETAERLARQGITLAYDGMVLAF